jgi:hypothetical protein
LFILTLILSRRLMMAAADKYLARLISALAV